MCNRHGQGMEQPKNKAHTRNSGRWSGRPLRPHSLDQSWLLSPGKEMDVIAQTPWLDAGLEEGMSTAQCLHFQGRWPSSAEIFWAIGGVGNENTPRCHLLLGLVRTENQTIRRVTANKDLSLREKSWLAAATLRPQRGPTRPAWGQAAPFPPLGLVPFRCKEIQLRDHGRSSRAGHTAQPGGQKAARTGGPDGGVTAPAASVATTTSAPGLGEGESVPVATQRPGDVRRLSLVSKVTGPAAGLGTICVRPQRGC